MVAKRIPVLTSHWTTELQDTLLSVYYPDQQMHNIYINNILFIKSTPTCFNASASSSGSFNLVIVKVTKLLKLQLNKIGRFEFSHAPCWMIKYNL